MRNKQAFKNMLSSLILQLVVALSGIILPRFFIMAYGSSVNGMVSSVGQFLTYLALVEAGISSAALVELYKPLADGDEKSRNQVLTATKRFYYRSGLLYVLLLVFLLVGYPLLVQNQVDHSMTRWMILILAGSNLVDYFFLGKYKALLTADQKVYVMNIIQTAGTVVSTVVTIGIIGMNGSALLAKGVATVVYVLRAFFVTLYVKKHYRGLDFHTEPDKPMLKERWSALLHQIVGVICNNTDLILLTVFMGAKSLLEVSVYYVYNMVATAVTALIGSFSNGLGSGFGQLIALGDEENLKRAYSNYEYMYFIVLFCCYGCMAVLLLPFVAVYTTGVTDAVYVRGEIAILFVLMGLIQNMRIPGMTMICAAGHFTQTRSRAIAEAVINLTVSLALIKPFGMAGVLMGTVCSYSYRTLDNIIYNSKYLVHGAVWLSLRRIARNAAVMGVLVFVAYKIGLMNCSGWGQWFFHAILVGLSSLLVLVFINFIMEPQEMKQLIGRVKNVIKR